MIIISQSYREIISCKTAKNIPAKTIEKKQSNKQI